MKDALTREISQLKQQRNALILSHYYQDGDIQDIADAIGDSLFLAQEGYKSKADVILLAGVVFMAESVKILSPEKTVLVPDLDAGCSLVSGTPTEPFRKWRESYKNPVVVTYVNSSAEVKALSDVICTSSNAERIVNSIPKDRPVLFGPDKNLGRYIAKKTGREMVLWPGACEVHVLFSAQQMYELKRAHPNAYVVAHPECEDEVLGYSDFIGSTSALLAEVQKSPAKEFIVATEDGILHQMRLKRPDAQFFQAPTNDGCACNQCPYMKKNNLEKIRDALRDLKPQVSVEEGLRKRAMLPLERMLAISAGKAVSYESASV
jgi:quinolinate synthase